MVVLILINKNTREVNIYAFTFHYIKLPEPWLGVSYVFISGNNSYGFFL